MIKQQLGDRLDGWIHTAFPFLFVRPLNPNLLTVLGAIGSIVAAAAFAEGWLVCGGILMLASGFFDLVDGVVARHRGIATRFGAFLDSTLDRLADVVILVGLSIHFARIGEPGNVLLVGAALTVTVLVSYSAARAKHSLPEGINVGFFERGERVGLLAAGAILGFLVPALWILTIGSTATLAQRFVRAYREMERLDAEERNSPEAPDLRTDT
ncbi:MAG: CDP-alcohol phosphatidyltransferase family protein [Deltaproteobacteria bacterium]|jgi:phosphatidylglycerophosphate synthase|nr:CDP-alcohol phosphatidyltransferase family protein [Deltaproteobacteria bacterium]